MAEILEDYEFIGAGSGKYPWDLWLDGQVWKLVRGTDYECTSASMRTSAQQVGKNRNKDVRTNMIMDGKGIVVQAKGEV
jgi:hypothetical protein